MILKKLFYLSTHRGTKENDILLGRFARAHLSSLTADEIALYELFLQEPDPEIYEWVMEKAPAPEKYQELVKKISLSP